MIKRTIPLILVSGFVSVLLLIIGTAVMDRISPVFASQLPALVAGHAEKVPVADVLPADNKMLDLSQKSETSTPEAVATCSAKIQASKTPSATPEVKPTLSPTMPAVPSVTMNITKLLADPSSYLDRVVKVAGRVTPLSSHKFLLNDGTSQIIIEQDDLKMVAVTNGMTLTVVGKFEKIDSNNGFYIEAHALMVTGSAIIASSCEFDSFNGDDDCDDDDMDEMDDDKDDDMDDDDDDLDDDDDDMNDDDDDDDKDDDD